MTRALVFGRAKSVWDEIAIARHNLKFDYTFGVGSTAVEFREALTGIVSFHSELFQRWSEIRQQRGYPEPEYYWTNRKPRIRIGTPLNWKGRIKEVDCAGGSSGLIGVMVALNAYRADEVVLAGIPLVPEAGQYDTGKDWREALTHRDSWTARKKILEGRVFSLSGWTRETFGYPPGIANVAA